MIEIAFWLLAAMVSFATPFAAVGLVLWWNGIERFEIGRQGGGPYLTRWTLLGRRFNTQRGKLFLHKFHRSDGDTLHDHPWSYWSLILWPGYWEQTPDGLSWYGPLSLLRRPAEWRHRVVLDQGRPCWTLLWAGRKTRGWGFHCPGGWIPWKKHAENEAATGHGCGDVEGPAS